MTEDHVFPEDTGTGASRGDNADAANFGAFAQHELLSDYKASGLSIQNVDYTNLTFDLTAGKAFVKDSSAETAQSGDIRDQGVVYEVEVASRTALNLTDATTNEVFIDVDLTTDDSVSITVLTDGTTPSAPFLKIAEIDTSEDTLDESYANSLDVNDKDLTDGLTTIYDSSANEIPETSLATISNSTLSNSSFIINANDGISGGGSVSLGNSIGINVSASDFAGSGLTTDGSNNIDLTNDSVTINSGNGISGGGTVSLGGTLSVDITENGIQLTEIDESIAPTWTGSHDFTSGGIVVPEPTGSTDAATKAFVESVAQGLTLKDSVKVSNHDVNIDLTSSTDPNPIDGITLNDGDRILLKHQTTLSENGIYDAVTATDPTTWVRSSDFDEDAEVVQGAFTFVRDGTHANESYVVITADPITVGTDAIEFAQFAQAGQLSGGTNISVLGDVIDVSPQGSGSGLDADTVDGFDIQKNGTDGNGIINFKT